MRRKVTLTCVSYPEGAMFYGEQVAQRIWELADMLESFDADVQIVGPSEGDETTTLGMFRDLGNQIAEAVLTCRGLQSE